MPRNLFKPNFIDKTENTGFQKEMVKQIYYVIYSNLNVLTITENTALQYKI